MFPALPFDKLSPIQQRNAWKRGDPSVPPGWEPPAPKTTGPKAGDYLNPTAVRVNLDRWYGHDEDTILDHLTSYLNDLEQAGVSPLAIELVLKGRVVHRIDNPDYRVGDVRQARASRASTLRF